MKRIGRRLTAALLWGGLLLTAGGCQEGLGTSYETVSPQVGEIVNLVEDTGSVTYRDPASLIPVVSGKIVSCLVEEGDTVTQGQTLYVIDSTSLEDQITQSRLSLRSAQESAAQSAAACRDLTVRASASGTITAVQCHVGEYVSAGTPVAQVVDSGSLTLTVPFSAADAAGISAGAAAAVTFSSFSGSVTGTVERVYATPTVLGGGRAGVYVEIRFSNPGAVESGTQAMASVGGAACMEAGAVAYATEQSIYAAQSGQVQSISVQEGDAVDSGQAVMTLKNDSLTNAATNAQLSAETAAVSLAQLEAQREDYTILAPADGIILTRSAREGDFASAGAALATLVEEESMCVTADIDEIYIDRVWPGQEASVTFTDDAGEQRAYGAQVRRVDDNGVTSGGVTNYPVELTLEHTDGLRAGMNVSVSIVTLRKEDCLRVPSEAVSGNTVRVLRGGTAVEVPVTTGVTGGGYTEITEGLTEEDAVILPE